ncbi:hypothetical protein [Teredinibacter haidensis]|uniref:hypothetical protein n=1 Tax=Teredinibacter haidensis TaxID=2731755 RepID=UPI000948B65B|nr:hypothetical protein [Teredinibacter haidensis]
METRDPPSLLNKVITPPLLLVGGVSAVLWFIYRVAFLYKNISESMVVFDKGSYYMLGVGIGLLTLAFVTLKEFWGGNPITKKQNHILTKLAISGLALLFIVPHAAHFFANKHLVTHGYSVCEDASHQWLFVRDIVYIQPSIECSAELKNEITK